MDNEAENLKQARYSYDQFALALKIEAISNAFSVLLLGAAYYFFSDHLRLLVWFKASVAAFAAGTVLSIIAYILIARACVRLESGSEDASRSSAIAAGVCALVAMFLFSVGFALPFIGWLWI